MPQEYLTNTPLETALTRYLAELKAAGAAPGAETVPVREARGRRLAGAVYAARSVPHYLASAMDGIAVRAEWTFGASETAPVTLDRGQILPVDTGDSMPDGMDAVIMIEDVIADGDRVRLIAPAAPWQHVRQIGEDFCAGDMLACSGTLLTPALLGALVAGGITQVPVFCRPLITLIPTGDEIVPATDEPVPGRIPEFNTTVYGSFLEADGARVQVTPIMPDDADLLRAALADAVAQSDIVMLLAGSSAGRDDLSARIIASLGKIVLHGIAIRPGKPAILGICQGKPVIGLPGYPVSGLVVLEAVARPLLRTIYRLDIPDRPTATACLTRRIVSSLKYQEHIRVRLTESRGRLVATPLDRGAGILTSYARADGLLVIPRDSEGLDESTDVTVQLLRPLAGIGQAISVIGSHDPLLDELADLLDGEMADESDTAGGAGAGKTGAGGNAEPAADGGRVTLSSVHVGSMGGLLAIRRGEAQIAGIHLLDEATGIYNEPFVRRYFPQGGVVLIEGVRRMQGLMVQPGNPLSISGIADIADRSLRYVNRQKGAGTRLLLDHQLRLAGIASGRLSGYTREEYTHTGVAAQIAAGSADAGLGILAAARIAGLDFLPVAEESYDFLMSADALNRPGIRRFLALLESPAFRMRLERLGGYRLEQPGRVILPATSSQFGGKDRHD